MSVFLAQESTRSTPRTMEIARLRGVRFRIPGRHFLISLRAHPMNTTVTLRRLAPLFAALALAGCDERAAALAKNAVPGEELPRISPKPEKRAPLRPRHAGFIDLKLIPECSGLARSKTRPGLYWTINDSGCAPRLFAVDAQGKLAPRRAGEAFAGIIVTGAKNIDWEALAVDDAGRLIIADFGNNNSSRRDLRLYVLPAEPDPAKDTKTPKAVVVPFIFADQTVFPDPKKNHDAEAMFCLRGEVFVLTKEWGAPGSVLHRIDMTAKEGAPKPTVPVCRFDSLGMVTDAAVSPDGRRLAVLTYTGVWIFEIPPEPGSNPLSGPARYRATAYPLAPPSWQVEAIAFSDDATLLIGDEQGDFFSVPLSEIPPAR